MADDTTMVACPVCGFPGEAGTFCINGCGVRLTQSETPRPETTAAVPGDTGAAQPAVPAASVPEGGDAAPRAGAPLPEQALAKLLAAMQKVAPAQPVAQSPASAQFAPQVPQPVTVTNIAPVPLPVRPLRPEPARWTSGELPPASAAVCGPAPEPVSPEVTVPEAANIQIRLTGRFPSEFVEGFVSPLSFKVQTTEPQRVYKSVSLSICKDGGVLVPLGSVSDVGACEVSISHNHTPTAGVSGWMNVRLRLECRRTDNDDSEVYESDDIDVYVWPKETSKAAVPLTVAPTFGNVTADKAGDVKIDLHMNDAPSGSAETPEQKFRASLKTVQNRDYALHIVSLPRRLTLWTEGEGKVVHLLAGDRLRFGKHRMANDVVTRVFNADGTLDEDTSKPISKIHFTIENDQDDCVFVDGGVVPEGKMKNISGGTRLCSSYGSSLSGKMISGGGRAFLVAERENEIKLAPGVGKHVLGLSAFVRKCASCPHAESCSSPSYAIASLRLSRSDNLESYLAVWKCADLGDVLPELKGYFVEWDRNRFVLRGPAGGRGTLWPGMKVGDKVWVRPFKQSLL